MALHFTGEVVADVGWGIEAGNFTLNDTNAIRKDTPFLSMSKQMIAQTFNAFKYFFIAGIFPIVRYLWYVRFFPEITDRFFLQLTSSALHMRKSGTSAQRQDFLQHMMELQQKKGLSETEIVAHQLTLLFDGFETSATLISHCLLLVSGKAASPFHVIANACLTFLFPLLSFSWLDILINKKNYVWNCNSI